MFRLSRCCRHWSGGWRCGHLFVLSAFLDNIAGALIGGTMARHVFKGRVHIGFLAAIVAASNAGGAGSVIGDTTTTIMWLNGVSPITVLAAYVAAVAAFAVFGPLGALCQHRFQPILAHNVGHKPIHWRRSDRRTILLRGRANVLAPS